MNVEGQQEFNKCSTGWLKKSKLLTQYNSLLFLSHPVCTLNSIAALFSRQSNTHLLLE